MEGNAEFQKPLQGELKQESQALEFQEAGFIRRLKNRFNQTFRGEQEPTEPFPQLSVDIFFLGHVTRKDTEGIAEKFKWADVFIPEAPGWGFSSLELMRATSEGKLIASSKSPFNQALIDMVYKSHKLIAFIDVPSTHPLYKKFIEVMDNKIILLAGSFSKFLHSLDADEKEFDQLQKKRDEYMISRLKPTIQELLQRYPNLKQKKSINVLLSLGAAHTQVYLHLKKTNSYLEITRSFGIVPLRYSFTEELRRRHRFGKKINKELLSHVFLVTVHASNTILSY